MLEKYINQDIENPIYLFHGSPKRLDVLKPKKSHDSDGNIDNIATAIFLFPSFLKATPYAFKDTIKENSKDLDWDFKIPNTNDYPLMIMQNVNIDNDIVGYINVLKKDEYMIKDNNSYQYKCFKELEPIDVVVVKLRDYLNYYKIENSFKKSR